MLNWSVSLRYQLVRRYDVSNWSVLFTHQLDVTQTSQIGLTILSTSCAVMVCLSMVWGVQISHQNGPISFAYYVSKLPRRLRWFSLFKTPVSTLLQRLKDVCLIYQLWYQLWRLCYVLKRSVSLRYQLLRRHDVLNWLVLFTYQWDVARTSQIGQSHRCTSWDVAMTS